MKKTVIYNKLIRDKIPAIIKKDGWKPVLKTLNKKDFFQETKKKILEEAKELSVAESRDNIINEIVDIQELINVLTRELKFSPVRINNLRKSKNKKRGGFKKRLFLIREEKQ